ncbi:hypothetical protein JOB18_014105, partial [Solea senegalensis]
LLLLEISDISLSPDCRPLIGQKTLECEDDHIQNDLSKRPIQIVEGWGVDNSIFNFAPLTSSHVTLHCCGINTKEKLLDATADRQLAGAPELHSSSALPSRSHNSALLASHRSLCKCLELSIRPALLATQR